MLKQLHIRDLAVIAEVNLDLTAGFTALTGETGAGKSILIDALALALGERGDSQSIRAGAQRLEVTASFDATPTVRAWLAEQGLDEDGDDCILRRVVGSDGRSRAWINGRPVPVQSLKELGRHLVDICGQQDYQLLRHRDAQRQVLDASGELLELRARVAAAHSRWRTAADEEARLNDALRDRDSRREYLGFQVRELSALDLKQGEAAELEQEQRRLQHHGRIVSGLTTAMGLLYDDDGAAVSVADAAQGELEGLISVDAALAPAARLVQEAGIQLREAAELVRHQLDSLDQDPAREAEVADRIAAIHDLARKHKCAAEDLPGLLTRLEEELAQLDNSEQAGRDLAERSRTARRELESLAAELTKGRKAAATQLSRDVSTAMAALGMPNGQFVVRVAPLSTEAGIGADGADDVEFLVTANPGQPPGPLSRVASGGELSRLNLAIQVVGVAGSDIPTLVFDEVDAGVGGAVAEIVGRKLRELAGRHQVLCVTHLAQVASLAHQHATISKATKKSAGGAVTLTSVTLLDEATRVEETARMLGGIRITDQTRAHAREMLAAAAKTPKSSARKAKGETQERRGRTYSTRL